MATVGSPSPKRPNGNTSEVKSITRTGAVECYRNVSRHLLQWSMANANKNITNKHSTQMPIKMPNHNSNFDTRGGGFHSNPYSSKTGLSVNLKSVQYGL